MISLLHVLSLVSICYSVQHSERLGAARDGAENWFLSKEPTAVQSSVTESFGFFDEPDKEWRERKAVHIAERKAEEAYDASAQEGNMLGKHWWQIHYQPSFHCAFSQRIGAMGDGGKWVCDPHRIAHRVESEGAPCLVYSFGSRGEFSFEKAVQDRISPKCEVHIFDPHDPSKYKSGDPVPPGMKYHMYPLGLVGDEIGGVKAKTFPQIVKELGHEGRRIDILKIDCEGCEWRTYKDWFEAGVEAQQILVELHGAKLPDSNWTNAHDFYQHVFKQGYVIANKEPNTHGCSGSCVEYGLLKLDPAFGIAGGN